MVGIDAGGTKTRCVVLTLGGALAGSGTGPGANPNSGGDTAGALTTALREALGDLDRTHILTGVFGIAGAGSAGRPAAVSAARRAWQAVGLRGSPAVVTDIAVAFAAGTTEPKGIVVFSGTGAGAAVISDGAIVQRADGYGWLVGDEGSAVWLGKEAVRAALAAYDGRGSPTLLTDSVPRALLGPAVVAEIDSARRRPRHRTLAMAGASPPPGGPGAPAAALSQAAALSPAALPPGGGGTGTALLVHEAPCPQPGGGAAGPPGPLGAPPGQHGRPELPGTTPNPQLAQAIIKEVYGRPPAALGRLGPVVAAAAAAGDPVARRITDEAAEWLLRDVDAVRPALSDPCAPVVMHGSVLREGPVADAVRTGLRDRFAEAPRSAGDGAVGAAGLALRRLGHPLPG
ncbi:BadF/BadG/BcrA/BcrD ATPase family protein [Actinomadura sp. OS1-43]|uniref:N-acetylglucosamine kinase n=1 Tax=Actinomadura sp. OS1-43 TaxID=604315 RepID=UPI00255B15A7|nr:BadF/BadG/BcrA/BcrD ATPase family protein [Actinomadura sp. OS1-43]MDL4814614.1 BadF/BadG/BcrA/BcrD ATPase family protein [Actinomadura sp. OS1-43]